ncbi:MAG: S1C family serine protease [Patescibacteria group bacterium]|nr:S1C family serine protease [Patescibacteria group bacterium]
MNHKFSKLILLPIIFGILAGMLSGSIVYTYLFSYMNMGEIMLGAKWAKQVVSLPRLIDKETKRAIFSSLVTFYRVKPTIQSVADNIYLESDRLGYGFIITSDGWVMASDNILGRDFSRIAVVTNDGRTFSIKKIENDTRSGAVFVRLEATNLSPIAFGNPRDLTFGEDLYLFDNLGKTTKVSFRGLGYESQTTKTSLFMSSEKFEKFLFFEEEVDSDFGGAPLLNHRGEVVGIAKDIGTRETDRAISFNHAYASMQNLFKTGDVPKLFLGIQYIDLSHVISSESNLATRGALISTGAGGVGVLRYSPAWDAELKEGDIVLRVGLDELNEEYSLSERIVEYHAGDIVDFTILRDGEEKTVKVELGEL